ncbi:phosphoribosyl-dephospho-CoA transferase [Pelomonas saccharophila]|uniref:Phosphoribosyl-dephospho-CoA transferase n=1 Tax=Roseateles saccharophilus TaxID=304 RepID=A0ABU1YIB1_ROSSA|nr:malonate decarboxylase holo-[acyl-carrier-protein] synthase [Roseateles saccharophilus]MDR7267791.1 phosphoribosyl-dephospho-CoA transferase [Roseateles saccharophilus]
MTALHRHQLARLTPAGWQRLRSGAWDAQAQDCLRHWAEQGLPVVVTRQRDDDEHIAVGLCAPRRWNHRRIALSVERSEVLYFDEFPRLDQVVTQLPQSARAPTRQLALALQACGATARVYGSQGWQHLTGLQHVREGSDLDVWVGVDGEAQADAVSAALNAFASPSRRLDGELVFAGDAAVAWREWLAWRGGRAQALLVKRLHGASLEALA